MEEKFENKMEENLENHTVFSKEMHIKYLLSFFGNPTKKMLSLESSKMMILYFLLAGLDFLDAVPLLPLDKNLIIDWIYSQQTFTQNSGGFKGGLYLGSPFHCSEESLESSSESELDQGHLVHTYSALISLILLGDDLKRLRKKNLLDYIRTSQNSDGSFRATLDSYEADLRFLYSACAICHTLQDFSPINQESAVSFILSCQNMNGAFGLRPREESHSGATYCAVASLKLLGKLDCLPYKTKLVEFLVNRQVEWNPNREKGKIGGFQGRINKYPDSCYSFWSGASLKIMGYDSFINHESVKAYVLNCQETKKGGFKKFDFVSHADPIHTLHALFGLSLIRFEDLPEIDPLIGIAKKNK